MSQALRDQWITLIETVHQLQSELHGCQNAERKRLLEAQLEQALQRRQEIANELDALT